MKIDVYKLQVESAEARSIDEKRARKNFERVIQNEEDILKVRNGDNGVEFLV